MNRSRPSASASSGFLGFLITVLAIFWFLAGCTVPVPAGGAAAPLVTPAPRLSIGEKRATALAASAAATATVTPSPTLPASSVSPATPTPALPCAGAPNCGHCVWLPGEDGALLPFLVYEDGRSERMTDPNHAWNLSICPPR